jgi:predicted MPP superfamily phosphohydrolase
MRPHSIERKRREAIILPHDDSGLIHQTLKLLLKALRLSDKAKAAARDIAVNEKQLFFPNLPQDFAGVRILFLSDLHFPGFYGFSELLERHLAGLKFDYCFLGGDFSNGTGAEPEMVSKCLTRLIPVLGGFCGGIYSVLGNHDIYDTAILLEKMGVRVLINDSCVIKRGDGRIRLVGLDDHHHFRSLDWRQAEEEIRDAEEFKILLSHSPDNRKAAAKKGYSLMLSGHTHGGQICLPAGIPIMTHCRTRGKFAKGYWKMNGLIGYTSSGTGT